MLAAAAAAALILTGATETLAAGRVSRSAAMNRLVNPFSTLRYSRLSSTPFGLPTVDLESPFVVGAETPVLAGASDEPAAASAPPVVEEPETFSPTPTAVSGRPPYRPRVRSPFRPPPRPPF